MHKDFTRRGFIKRTIGAGLVIGGARLLEGCKGFDSKGLPTAVLGKTGVRIPRLVLGLGSRFCNIDSADEAVTMLEYALDNGLYYWDTAHIYENTKNGVISEERIGMVAKSRRDEIFLSTKVTSRDPNEAMKQIELSLKRLKTDHLDMLKIHDVHSVEDVAKISEKGNLIEIVSRLKEQKITRFIGFSGHADAEALKLVAERGDFDAMLIALNHWNFTNNPQKREELAIPVALEKGLGVILMKAVRPSEKDPSFQPRDLIRFALSLKGPSGVSLGMDSLNVVKSNLEILRNFQAMDTAEIKSISLRLGPLFNHGNIPWLNNGYCDGYWA
jgi:predicted aldo/keto reductase-like oxidoreductase